MKYHVLGGVLSPLDGIGPDDLAIEPLLRRAAEFTEIVLAVNATVEGQTTAHYITDRLAGSGVKVTRLAHGVPVGGELDYLDEGTLARRCKAPHAKSSRSVHALAAVEPVPVPLLGIEHLVRRLLDIVVAEQIGFLLLVLVEQVEQLVVVRRQRLAVILGIVVDRRRDPSLRRAGSRAR